MYATDQDLDLLQRLSVRMDRSQAGVMRQLLREKAKELGLITEAELDSD